MITAAEIAERVTRRIADMNGSDLSVTYPFAVAAIEREIAPLIDLLGEVEWAGAQDGFNSFCPVCGGMKPADYNTTRMDFGGACGHAEGCRLAAALRGTP